jgi:hypothetical protein
VVGAAGIPPNVDAYVKVYAVRERKLLPEKHSLFTKTKSVKNQGTYVNTSTDYIVITLASVPVQNPPPMQSSRSDAHALNLNSAMNDMSRARTSHIPHIKKASPTASELVWNMLRIAEPDGRSLAF